MPDNFGITDKEKLEVILENVSKKLYEIVAYEVTLIINEHKLNIELPRTWEEKDEDDSQLYWKLIGQEIIDIVLKY